MIRIKLGESLPTERKSCRCCYAFKPLSEFGKSSRYRDGHAIYCKSCKRSKRERRNILATNPTLTPEGERQHFGTIKGIASKIAKENKIAVGRQSDAIRQRCYDAERTLIRSDKNKRITKDEATALIRKVCADYNVRPPKNLVFGNPREGDVSYSWKIRNEIKISDWGRNEVVVLHEVAHWIDQTYLEGHSPVWVGIYIELLDRYSAFSREEAEAAFVAGKVPFVR